MSDMPKEIWARKMPYGDWAVLTDPLAYKDNADIKYHHHSMADELADILERLKDESTDSVEYSDWPELQKLVDEAEQALAKYRGEE